jgi:ABC-2 type transport system permease protein
MEFFWASIRKDLMRWRQDFTAILLWLSIPLIIGGLITSMIDGNGGVKPHGVLLIADLDDTLLSGLVAGAYSQGELGELISVEKTTVEAGTESINAGEASGLLVIPKGFTEALLDSKPVTLTLKTNPAQTILPGIISDVTDVLLDAGFYARQLFGDEIDQIQDMAAADQSSDQKVAAIAVAMQNKIESAAPLLFPPAIDITIADPPADQPTVPLALLFLPGIILMAVMFASNGLAGDYWTERENGTLRRLVYAPAQLTAFLAGKALAAGLVVTLTGGVALVIGFLYHDISWAKLPSSLIWITLSGIALFSWFGALQMLAKTQRAANLLTSMLLFPLLMAGGSFFPFAALPGWIAAIGRRTPNGFVVDRLSAELTASAAWTIDPQSWLVIFLMAASGLAICAWRLRAGFAQG